jgi:quinol monooxygenase YgiN
MVTLIATLKIKEGKMKEAIQILKEMAANIKASETGTLEYIPHTVKGEGLENTIIFYEKYKNDEAAKIHRKNLSKTASKLSPLLEPGMDIKTCEEIK